MRKFSGQLFFKTASLITSRSSRPEVFWWSLLDEFDQLWGLSFNFSIWLLIKFSFQFTWEFNPRFISVIFRKQTMDLGSHNPGITREPTGQVCSSPSHVFSNWAFCTISFSLSLFEAFHCFNIENWKCFQFLWKFFFFLQTTWCHFYRHSYPVNFASEIFYLFAW